MRVLAMSMVLTMWMRSSVFFALA